MQRCKFGSRVGGVVHDGLEVVAAAVGLSPNTLVAIRVGLGVFVVTEG